MGKKRIVLFLLVLVILISGCQNGGTKDKVSGAYVGGSDGLAISFLENEPPFRVLDADSDEFFITLIMENIGEYDINTGGIKVTLGGINQKEFQIKEMTKGNENLIRGMSREREEIIAGDLDEISYTARYKGDLNADFRVIVSANVCYDYGTRVLANLCLRKDVSARVKSSDVCVVDSGKNVQNSGGPIQVTNLMERPVGRGIIRITFDVENIGIGEVYQRGAFSQTCYEDKDKKDRVNIGLGDIGSMKFKCSKLGWSNEGVVKLVGGKTTVSCEADTKGEQEIAFESPLNINLDYVYKDFVDAELIVEDAV